MLQMLQTFPTLGAKGTVPKHKSTRCSKHSNSANKELDWQGLSHVEVSILFSPSLCETKSACGHADSVLTIGYLQDMASFSLEKTAESQTVIL